METLFFEGGTSLRERKRVGLSLPTGSSPRGGKGGKCGGIRKEGSEV